jgi:hypothetical protein
MMKEQLQVLRKLRTRWKMEDGQFNVHEVPDTFTLEGSSAPSIAVVAVA